MYCIAAINITIYRYALLWEEGDEDHTYTGKSMLLCLDPLRDSQVNPCQSTVMVVFIHSDSSCDHFWESNQDLQACYQFNLYTILTWSQALHTCQAQGGSLLSITSLDEYQYIIGMSEANTCQ